MSSIVKAKLLTYIPKSNDYSVDNFAYSANSPSVSNSGSAESIAANTEMASGDMGMIERQEAILNQAIKKSQHIENEAQRKADSIMENAMRNSREIMSEAEKKGYEEGYLRGLVDGASASEQAAGEGLDELARLIQCFKDEQRETLKRQEHEMIEIAFELAKKIMKHHVQADETAVTRMLEEIIQENEGSMKILLSEYQRSLGFRIDKSVAQKLKKLAGETKVVIIKEEDLMMSENEGGIVDMSVPVQLEQLKKAVER
ncbi:FliH/SctL family protein [Anoxybacterium hadale]|uniref:FliH/SctL family protein n=1 Tax=Anoxybacterium hadale TaxID=3408580 RepID=UPI003AFFBFCD